jgi:DNA-directed RNA polymerase specialized sigma24 family protein
MADKEFYTQSEVLKSVESISRAEMGKILRIANWRVLGLSNLSGMELFQEAIKRILTCDRKWPKNINFMTLINGVFRSMVNQYWQDHYDKIEHTESFDEDTLDATNVSQNGISTSIAINNIDPQKNLEAKEFLQEIEIFFSDDEQALTVFMAQQDGYKASEIKKDFGFSEKEYDTITKRIRRKLSKFSLREVENAAG